MISPSPSLSRHRAAAVLETRARSGFSGLNIFIRAIRRTKAQQSTAHRLNTLLFTAACTTASLSLLACFTDGRFIN
jgi:hypothetical protein